MTAKLDLDAEGMRLHILSRRKAHYAANKELYAEKNRIQYAKNAEKAKAYSAAYRKKHHDQCKAVVADWRKRNPEAAAESDRNYKAKPETRLRRNKRNRERWSTDANFKLGLLVRNRLNNLLKGKIKPASSVMMLGCTLEALKAHLESLFQPGMTWANHGEWHIDHKKPLHLFDLEDPEQFAQACHFTNLQPLWKLDNLKKSGKFHAPD